MPSPHREPLNSDDEDDCVTDTAVANAAPVTLAQRSPLVDLPRIERAVREILAGVGEDPDRDGLLETPGRVARMYAELFSDLHMQPARHLQKTFSERYDELVLVRDISFNSMCEHHLLPFIGTALVLAGPDGARLLTRTVLGESFVNLELHGIDFLGIDDGLGELTALEHCTKGGQTVG